MTRPVVLVGASLPGGAEARLRARADVHVTAFATAEGARVLPSADALLPMVWDRVDDALLDAAPNVRVVSSCSVGLDHVDVAACRRRGVEVAHTPDVLTDATADMTWALLLDAARRVTEGDRVVRAGGFGGWTPSFMLGVPVAGRTLGVVGLGRIGQAVARRARGFAMDVIYAGRRRADDDVERALGARQVELDDLFRQADFVCLTCPLTDATRGIVDARRLALLKPTAVLVNTARGALVDEGALAEALAARTLFAAGLDVYTNEPEVHPALLASEHAVLAPHLGSADHATRAAMADLAVENLLRVLDGHAPKTPAPPTG